MANSIDQIARLILKTVGTEAIRDAGQEAAYTRKAIDQLGAAYMAEELTFAQFQANLTRLNTELAKQEKLLGALTGAEARQQAETAAASAALNAEAEAARKASQALADYAATTTPLPNPIRAQAEATKKATAAFADYAGIAPKAAAASHDPLAVFRSLRMETDQLSRSGVAAAGTARAGGQAAGNGAMGWLMLARAVEDSQYGFAGVVNNIPQLVMAMGGSAGLAGAANLAAVAVNQISKNWDGLTHTVSSFLGTAGEVKQWSKEVRTYIEDAWNANADFLPGFSFNTRAMAQAAAGQKREEERDKQNQATYERVAGIEEAPKNKEQAAAVAKAISEAGGGKSVIDELFNAIYGKNKDYLGDDPENVKRRELAKQNIARGIQNAMNGDAAAMEGLATQADGTRFGRSLRNQMTNMISTADERDFVEFNQRAQKQRKQMEDLNKQGAENQAEMIEEMAKAARGDVRGRSGARMDDLITEMRAAGATAAQQKDRIEKFARAALIDANPLLREFPQTLERLTKEMAGEAIEAIEKAEEAIAVEEQITVEEVRRRRGQALQQRREQQQAGQATEEFAGLVANAEQFFRQFNPGMPAMTQQQRNAMAAQMQAHMDDLGIDRDRQREIARTISNPQQFRQAQQLIMGMQAAGIDEKTALERLPAIFERAAGGNIQVAQEVNRQVNALMRLNGRLFNEQMRLRQETMQNSMALQVFMANFNNAQNRGR